MKQFSINRKDHSKYYAQKESQKIASLLKKMDEGEIKLIDSQNAIFKRMKSLPGSDPLDQKSMQYFLSQPLEFLGNVQHQLYDLLVDTQSKEPIALPNENEKIKDGGNTAAGSNPATAAHSVVLEPSAPGTVRTSAVGQ